MFNKRFACFDGLFSAGTVFGYRTTSDKSRRERTAAAAARRRAKMSLTIMVTSRIISTVVMVRVRALGTPRVVG
jgi:hypothetical protein